MNVGHGDVNLDDLKPSGSFDLSDDVVADAVTHVEDGVAVLDDDGYVDSGLGLSLVDADTAGDVCLASGNTVGYRAECATHRIAHVVDARNLASCHASDLGDDILFDSGRPVVGLEWSFGLLIRFGVRAVFALAAGLGYCCIAHWIPFR